MTRWTRRLASLATAGTLAASTLLLARPAAAHGRGGPHRGPTVVVRGFYPLYSPYFAFGYGPYFGPYWGWGPYAYAPPGDIDMNVALAAGLGAVDLNVKPGSAEVWVDGRYYGEARDLDGYPSFLWLADGVHRIVVCKGGYASFDEPIDVQRGVAKELKVRLEKGQSEPPGQKPGKSD
jgi:hypothetical protein